MAHYSGKNEKTVRRMCRNRKIESEFVGGEWMISSPGVMRRFWRLGKDFWKKVLDDMYRNSPEDAREAYEDYLAIAAVERERSRGSGRG